MKGIRYWSLVIGLWGMLTGASFAQTPAALDTLFLSRGDRIAGRIVSLDGANFRVQKPLPPAPGASAASPPVFATVTIPRADISSIEFAPNEARERLLNSATTAQIRDVENLWNRERPYLSLARSPAARVGLLYGNLLLQTNQPADSAQALEIFQLIERENWNLDDLMLAKQGRLRAMVATGRAAEAIQEATELQKLSEDPVVLIQAKSLLAEAADKTLRQLIADNPRWTEDVQIIPERNRLYHEALDLYLFPALFFGSDAAAAARGLWGAVGIYCFTGETAEAIECARDLLALYPSTPQAAQARQFLDALPDSERSLDREKLASDDSHQP